MLRSSGRQGVVAAASRSTCRVPRAAILAVAAVLLLPVVPARAQGPPNDDRANAVALTTLPASVDGTTVGSTLEADEPGLSCAGEPRGTVWYEITTPAKARIVVRLAAKGNLDAVLDVYSRIRSQISPVACEVKDCTPGLKTLRPTQLFGEWARFTR